MSINKFRVITPNENNNFLKFKNYKQKEKVPFIVYVNIEYVPIIAAYYLRSNFDDSLSEIHIYRR